jgi:hypothetical protein
MGFRSSASQVTELSWCWDKNWQQTSVDVKNGWIACHWGRTKKVTRCRFEPCPDYTVYLIPGSRVKTIGEFGMSREWWCKVRGTYNGGVPETKETKRMGDHALSSNLHHNSQVACWHTHRS